MKFNNIKDTQPERKKVVWLKYVERTLCSTCRNFSTKVFIKKGRLLFCVNPRITIYDVNIRGRLQLIHSADVIGWSEINRSTGEKKV